MKILSVLFVLLIEIANAQLPIFPGAEGYGKFVRGGRGGKVLSVTSIEDRGAGTLRTMLEDSAFSRIIVFRTSGVCRLESNIMVTHPHFTLVPWTAPGDGFIIRGGAIGINADDWAIIGATILVGDSVVGPQPDNRDAIQINDTSAQWMVAFSDLGWWIDSNQMLDGPDSGSFTYNFSFEALDSSLHPKGSHGDHLNVSGSTNIFLGWNLFAHGKARMFQAAMDCDRIVAVNNVIYNFNSAGTELMPDTTERRNIDMLGNVYILGPDSIAGMKEITVSGGVVHPEKFWKGYLQRNVGRSGTDWQLVQNSTTPGDTIQYRSPFEVVPTLPRGYREYPTASNEVRNFVLERSGSRIPAMRAIDSTIISNVRNQTGRIKDCVGPASVGVPKTIFWPDSTVLSFGNNASVDTIRVLAMPGGVVADRYNNQTVQVFFAGDVTSESKTIIDTQLEANGTLPDTVLLITGNWTTNPSPNDAYRIYNVYNDPDAATLPYPTITQVTWADIDLDGLPNWLEKRLLNSSIDSTSAVPNGDLDGDGYDNVEEWWIDMIPLIQPTVIKR